MTKPEKGLLQLCYWKKGEKGRQHYTHGTLTTLNSKDPINYLDKRLPIWDDVIDSLDLLCKLRNLRETNQLQKLQLMGNYVSLHQEWRVNNKLLTCVDIAQHMWPCDLHTVFIFRCLSLILVILFIILIQEKYSEFKIFGSLI